MIAGLLAAVLVGAWTALLWTLWARREQSCGSPWSRRGLRDLALISGASLITAVLAAPTLWRALLAGYPEDSFFTLALGPRAGLVLLTGLLVCALVWVSAVKSAALRRGAGRLGLPPLVALAADLPASLLVFAAAWSLSPQIYYGYYRLVMPGLPAQWVLKDWPDPEPLLRLAQLPQDASLADHLAGLTLWALLIMTGWLFVLGRPRRSWSGLRVGGGAALLCALIHLVGEI